MKLIILSAISVWSIPTASGFHSQPVTRTGNRLHHRQLTPKKSSVARFAENSDEEAIPTKEQVASDRKNQVQDAGLKALGAASSSSNDIDEQDMKAPESRESTVSSTFVMIPRDLKRTMIEELGYKRKEVDSIRLELVRNIIENRIQCPSEGMPIDWIDRDREELNKSVQNGSNMMERLENESKYPLKFPLLGVSLVLFGKGFSDALITLIKVNMDFPGASLTAQFQGIPVLAIDIVCVLAGAGLGLWTWKTMK